MIEKYGLITEQKWNTCKFKEPPCMSREIKTSMRKKNRLYKKYVSNGCNADDMICLNNQSIYCAELISSAKDNHYKKLANKLNDPLLGPKAYWSILNGFLGKAKIPMIPPLFVNNSFETDFLKKLIYLTIILLNSVLYLIMTAFCLS